MKEILITGGAGFIGYYLSKMLSEDKDNHIHIVDNLSKSKIDSEFLNLIENDNVSFSKLDLSDLDSYSKIDSEYDQIYHLAAIVGVKRVSENPVLTLRVNTFSTLYLLDYINNMKHNPKILFGSSCENYSCSIKCCNIEIPTPENVPLCIEDLYNPRWTYACSKILGEIACLHYSKECNFNTTIVRFHNIYGPRMGSQHVIPEFILRLKRHASKLEMYGGYQYRSFCYISDAAKMIINLMNNKDANNKIVNVGGDNYIKIASLAKMLCNIMGVSVEFIEKGAPKGSVEKRKPDLSIIKELKNYVSEVSFDKGLRKTYEWYNKLN